MKLVSASYTAAVLLGIGALLHPNDSYAALPYCPPNCPSLHLECIKGNSTACNTYAQMCTNCMDRDDGRTPLLKHDITTNTAWVNSHQATFTQ
jgi:hypothetical protein